MPSELASDPPRGLAARAEDRLHAWRGRRAIRKGRVPVVVAFPGYGGAGWIRALCRVLLEHEPTAGRPGGGSARGWRSFTSIHAGHVSVTVEAGGTETTVSADRGGIVDARIEVPLPPGWNEVSFRVGDGPSTVGRVFVVAAHAGIGLVSDVDDTVMVTALPRPLLAAWNTLVLDEHARQSVPGMAVLYERILLRNPGAPVVYLSTGAWNVAPTLSRFLERHLFPPGALLLTDWGPTPDRLFRDGQQHKRANLERLAADFPGLRWILVGDDGQHDQALYAEFAATHPDRVAAVAIRELTAGEAVFAGGRTSNGSRRAAHESAARADTLREHAAGERTGPPTVRAPDGAGLLEALERLGRA